ncbi:hypothetical protein AC578_1888 [Pseudocercospora eumusae]|uniref:Uncharacterized protein n=1 Tax=Pseudocercospora eumusae TaxID=321146 RepID=A0A139H3G2_9PEZI|nr:hypothetical protein AC578_1888 [Pseudocercospora eumusae]
MWKLGIHHGFNYTPVQEGPTANSDCPCIKTGERQWYSRGGVILCIILLSNALAASVSFLLLRREQVSAAFVCAGDVQPATQWMSEVDQSLHSSKFLPWIASPTQYSADTADLGDSVDDAWKDLGVYYKLLLLPAQYADAYNISAGKHWLVTPEDNQDAPYAGFPVNIEALHHVGDSNLDSRACSLRYQHRNLHCINFLRQGLYYNYDFYRSNPSYFFSEGSEREIRDHLAHCVDALRQLVMCWSDTDVLPLLRPTLPTDKPRITDFSRVKRCRNFESLRIWSEKRQWAGAANVAPKHGN